MKRTSTKEEVFGNRKSALCLKYAEVGPAAQINNVEEHPVLHLSLKFLQRDKNRHKWKRLPGYEMCSWKTTLLAWEKIQSSDGSFSVALEGENKETNSSATSWFLSCQPFNFSAVHRTGLCHEDAECPVPLWCLLVIIHPAEYASLKLKI